ncbi:hypothetical protein [Gluconacetobacter entanii]|uniref:Uncharacterized protein n=1 Tax=Gluconacetobacter entanii TaxID=108528 RepID=A0A318PSZ3_9PROT|nr:hypothetical protein [Gluconacetobacter entanii]MCE2578081.1 hypothetical protein [Komagataeibacter sp. FNDCR1]PYD61998.1 hypothetical protein CFR72_13610 [Gluconacetobacter entanii]
MTVIPMPRRDDNRRNFPEDPIMRDMLMQGGHKADLARMFMARQELSRAFIAAVRSAPDLEMMREEAAMTGKVLGYFCAFEEAER